MSVTTAKAFARQLRYVKTQHSKDFLFKGEQKAKRRSTSEKALVIGNGRENVRKGEKERQEE